MSKNYLIGFPRIGEQRELKFALEAYWSKQSSLQKLEVTAKELRRKHWQYQKDAGIEFISCNDFSFYDNMLDTSVMIGAIPERFKELSGLEQYFAMARGTKKSPAMEMTKWFNTNYHYIVPELSQQDIYTLNLSKIKQEYSEAKELGITPKINIIGPLTYLGLSKRVDGADVYDLYTKIAAIYEELVTEIAKLDDTVTIQIDEPIFVKESVSNILSLIKPTYDRLCNAAANVKIAVVSYFEHSCEATNILVHTPIWAIGLDFVHGAQNLQSLEVIAKSSKILIAGIVDGRNIWKNDFDASLQLLAKITDKVTKSSLLLSSSCSLLHTPFTLNYETKMDPQLRSWLSYAVEKLDEIALLAKIFFEETLTQEDQQNILQNKEAILQKSRSPRIHDQKVQSAIEKLEKFEREGKFEERIKLQKELLQYKDLATTTIGSFPQTQQLRDARKNLKNGLISQETYDLTIKEYIDHCIAFQEECGLEILVHGEPERNDMVEYFGEQLQGFGFSQNGWVQSYGSRCVKPPFIYGDISRRKAMTVAWSSYAQSRTHKIMKGILTGPVTILNWSFVRDDIPRSEVSKQIALAINEEVNDLQNAGIKIIQVDEAAFKEGYPHRADKIAAYEAWALRDFKIAVSSARKETQIHTHMCYSDFNDIIATIEAMDADVISIETARSGNKLLKIFKQAGYKQEIGPGIYDIHSPRVPSVDEMVKQIEALLEVLPKTQLWINPDCGLKTRKWEEVKPSLQNMVEAVNKVRNSSL